MAQNVDNDDNADAHRSPNSEITRRDFVGGTLIGSGVALLAAPALSACTPEQNAPSVNPMLTGLGPEWTGPGGVGDYAGKNGNTHTIVNAAHGDIRNGSLNDRIGDVTVGDGLYDVVIVGAGISGLTSAYKIVSERPHAKVLILDQHEIFGGEAKQNDFDVDGYRITAPQGSTGIVVPFVRAAATGFPVPLKRQLRFPDNFTFQEPENLSQPIKVPYDNWGPMHISWEMSDTAFFYEGHGMVKNPWSNGFREAPIPEHIKSALVALELYRTPPQRDDWDRWLDTMTYKDFLRNVAEVPEDALDGVCAYLDPVMAAMGCGQGSDIISAYSAFSYLMPGVNAYSRYLNGGEDPTDVLHLATFPGGNTYQAKRLIKLAKPDALSGGDGLYDVTYANVNWENLDRPDDHYRMRLGATVFSVVHEGEPGAAETVLVTYAKGSEMNAVRAKAVICAGQQHANKRICSDISPEYREAMEGFHHAPILTINVALRNWKFLDRLGVAAVRWFEGLGWWTSLRRNLILDGRETQPLDPNKPVVLTQYIPFLFPGTPWPQQCATARIRLFSMSYAEIENQVREQFTKMFGAYGFDADRDIAGIVTNRQGHAYLVTYPGFFFGKDGKKAPKDVLQEPFGRIVFGHSELAGVQMWETAVEQGLRAGEQALSKI